MKKVRKSLYRVLVNSLNTSQINDLGRSVDSRFDIHKESGFGEKIEIPRQVAADCILNFFNTDDRIMEFITYMISREGQNASGGVIHLRGLDQLFSSLRFYNWVFDEKSQRFLRDQSDVRTADWGLLRAGHEYTLVFASLDIVNSSEIVRNNIKDDVEVTMSRLREYMKSYIEKKNGRIWMWQGDGCLAVFYGTQAVTHAVIAMIQILAHLPIFNIAKNELRVENDIRLRIGVHIGTAVYQHEVSKITSSDIRITQDVEKSCAGPNSIAITVPVYESLWEEIRSAFTSSDPFEHLAVFVYKAI